MILGIGAYVTNNISMIDDDTILEKCVGLHMGSVGSSEHCLSIYVFLTRDMFQR